MPSPRGAWVGGRLICPFRAGPSKPLVGNSQNQHALKFLHTLFTGDIDDAQAALYKNSA